MINLLTVVGHRTLDALALLHNGRTRKLLASGSGWSFRAMPDTLQNPVLDALTAAWRVALIADE